MGSDGKKQSSGSRKWGKFIAATAVSLTVIYLWFFWFQTLTLLEMHYSYRHIPIAHMKPVELKDQSIAPSVGSNLSCFGYDFEVPWKDTDTEHIQRKNMVLIPFRSGLRLLVGHGSTHDLIDTVMEQTKTDPEHFRATYGDKAAQSDYEFLKLALNATPESVRLLDSKENTVRKSSLVLYKTFLVPGDSGIFKVQANGFKGFQYGDPRKLSRQITVTLYSAKGGIEFNFLPQKASPYPISQADINRVVQTVRFSGLAETNPQK